eukprot:31518-Pelagococcus_subviridis.AAC.11
MTTRHSGSVARNSHPGIPGGGGSGSDATRRATSSFAARSAPSSSFMRYCFDNVITALGCAADNSASGETPRPSSSARGERTSGGSCFGSPTRTNVSARSNGGNADGSVICPASSTSTTSKRPTDDDPARRHSRRAMSGLFATA